MDKTKGLTPISSRSGAHFEDPLMLISRTLSKLVTLWLNLTYPFASLGRDLSVHYTVLLHRPMAPRIKLGNSVTVGKDVWLNIIPEATDPLNIIIDDHCRIAARTWISAKNHIHIERDVTIAPEALIMDHGHAYENPNLSIRRQPAMEGGRIRIERGCAIGRGAAIVCSGGELVLGHDSVVAPNAVVVRSQPPYSLISGSPARVIERLGLSRAGLGASSRASKPEEPGSLQA